MQIKRIYLSFLNYFKFTDEIENLLKKNEKDISIKFLSGSLRSLTLAALWKKRNRDFLIITHSDKDAEDWYQNLQLFISTAQISLLTEPKSNVHFEIEKLDEHILWLIEGLSTIQSNSELVIITTPKILACSFLQPI